MEKASEDVRIVRIQHRQPAGERQEGFDEWMVRERDPLGALSEDRQATARFEPRSNLREQARLPDARFPGHQQDRRTSRPDAFQPALDQLELPLTPYERWVGCRRDRIASEEHPRPSLHPRRFRARKIHRHTHPEHAQQRGVELPTRGTLLGALRQQARRTRSLRYVGTAGFRAVGATGGRSLCMTSSSTRSAETNGGAPVSSSYSRVPRASRSQLGSLDPAQACSGAM